MTISSHTTSAATVGTALVPTLRSAVTAFLARYKGQFRVHRQSDLDSFLRWCDHAELEPLMVRRVDVELYLRWMQVQRKYKPSTVSRRLSVVSGFNRMCVIDGVLAQSPAEYVRRPRVSPESLLGGPNPLTERERVVLREALDGSTAAVLSSRLHLSAGTSGTIPPRPSARPA